jgi:hypothetical protein
MLYVAPQQKSLMSPYLTEHLNGQMCLWIHVHLDIPDTLIQSFLRNLVSREIENRPLCRPLIFMPDSFQLETDLVNAWNKIIPIQRDCFHQAEQGSFTNFKSIDPYDFYENHHNQRTAQARKWALRIQDSLDNFIHATFDCRITTPWQKEGVARMHP